MIDVVLDTNVLAASLLKSDGPNQELLRLIASRRDVFRVCYSSQMLAEYRDVLDRPFVTGRGLAEAADALVGLLCEIGEEVVPRFVPAIVYPDVDDKPFLEAAIYVHGILITNNLRDYPFLGVNVVGPEDFLAWWQQRM